MYIAQAFNVLHEWWRYAIGFVLIFIAIAIGQIPFGIAVMAKAMNDGDALQDLNEEMMLSMLEPNLNLFLLLLTYAAGLLGVVLVTKYLHKQTFLKLTTSRPKIDWKRFWFAFVFWGILSSALIILSYFLSPDDFVFNFKLVPFLILCVIAVVMIPLQTSFEEYFFRGYLMQGLGVISKTKWFPLIATSLIFGLLHITNPEIQKLGYIILVLYVGNGFLLGIMTLMDEGLELALGFHAANNIFIALIVTADWTALQTHSIFKDMSNPEAAGFVDVFIPVLIIYPLVLLVFARKYKWTDWKGKLLGRVKEPPAEDYKIIGE